MEGRFPGAERTWPGGLVAAVDRAASAYAIQFALRSLRARPARVRRLCALVYRSCLPARPGAGDRRPAPYELPAVPTTAAARLLFGRAGNGEAQAAAVCRLSKRPKPWCAIDGDRPPNASRRKSLPVFHQKQTRRVKLPPAIG